MRHAVRDRVAAFEPDVADIELLFISASRVTDQRNLDPGTPQQGGVFLALIEPVEALGDVVHRAGDDRHVRRRNAGCDAPGFRAAQHYDADVLVACEAQREIDVVDAVGVDDERKRAARDGFERGQAFARGRETACAALVVRRAMGGVVARVIEQRAKFAERIAARRRAVDDLVPRGGGRAGGFVAIDRAAEAAAARIDQDPRRRFAQHIVRRPGREVDQRRLPGDEAARGADADRGDAVLARRRDVGRFGEKAVPTPEVRRDRVVGARVAGRRFLAEFDQAEHRFDVDEAGRDEFPARVDAARAGRNRDMRSDGDDAAVAHEHSAVRDARCTDRFDRAADDGDRFGTRGKRREEQRGCEQGDRTAAH